MKNNQQGFGAIEIIVIAVILATLTVLGWVAITMLNKPKEEKSQTTSVSPAENKPQQAALALDKTYVDETGHFSFEYPASWSVKTEKGEQATSYPTTSTTLTSPDGTILNANSNWGGKGGACLPEQGDKCPSEKYLSIEKLPVSNVYYVQGYINDASGSSQPILKPIDIDLVTRLYTSQDGESIYEVGVTDSSAEHPIELNKLRVGFILPQISFTVYDLNGKFYPYIYLYAEGKTSSFLTSKDVDTIKSILRSLKVTF